MPFDPALTERTDIALRIEELDNLSHLTMALAKALQHVTQDKLPAHTDPAVRLIVARMAEVVGIAPRDDERARARTECMASVAKTDDRPMLLRLLARPLYHDDERKDRVHREIRRLLGQFAKAMGLGKADFDIHSNKGGPASGGDVYLQTDCFMIQVSPESCMGPHNAILFRTTKSRKDCTGGHNHFAAIDTLLDPAALAVRIHRELRLPLPPPKAPSDKTDLFAA
jgi:hypothetical protein